MPSCCVKRCKNRRIKGEESNGISFHRFPKDPVIRNEWKKVVSLQRNDDYWSPTDNTVICSQHFNEDDFYFTIQGFRKVKRTSIPKIKVQMIPVYSIPCEINKEPLKDPVNEIQSTPVINVKIEEEEDSSQDINEDNEFQSTSIISIKIEEEEHSSQAVNEVDRVHSVEITPITSIKSEIDEDSLKDVKKVEIDALENVNLDDKTVFDTPREQKMRLEINRLNCLKIKNRLKIGNLQKRNHRLQKKCEFLKRALKLLQKEKFVSDDTLKLIFSQIESPES